jgi:hypothetical protein
MNISRPDGPQKSFFNSRLVGVLFRFDGLISPRGKAALESESGKTNKLFEVSSAGLLYYPGRPRFNS